MLGLVVEVAADALDLVPGGFVGSGATGVFFSSLTPFVARRRGIRTGGWRPYDRQFIIVQALGAVP